MRIILNFFLAINLMIPISAESLPKSKGRTYAPEEGTFDRRKRIVIHPKCRLIKEENVPGDVICTYQSQKKSDKDKQIFLGSPGNKCAKEITCPIK
ncbi:MAG: hypothetical protein VX976_01425 [Pseudomonadota bacterium]|nr:hypothetical protein [Pseudomonadota bacterium]